MTTLASRITGVDHFTPPQLLRTAQLFATDPDDHGIASGAFHTVQGTLTEEAWTGTIHARQIAAAEGRGFGSRYVHSVTNRSTSTALSVHACSPALSEMTRYAVDGARLVTLGVDRAGEHW